MTEELTHRHLGRRGGLHKRTSRPLLCVLTMAILATACGHTTHKATPAVPPEPGTELPAFGPDEDIVRHIGYTASYNHTTLCPDWVAWQLTADKAAGSVEGQFSFSRDPDVDWPKASREDYSNSGFDKGHMAPRADMKWSAKALEESYYFTNICPQDHTMNSQAWRKIEELTRRMARRHGSVLAVCGPLYDSATPRHIGPACVHVPDRFFKALAVKTVDGWQTVAFVVENSPQDGSPRRYAISVDSVETLAARDLFPSLPPEAETDYDWTFWR